MVYLLYLYLPDITIADLAPLPIPPMPLQTEGHGYPRSATEISLKLDLPNSVNKTEFANESPIRCIEIEYRMVDEDGDDRWTKWANACAMPPFTDDEFCIKK